MSRSVGRATGLLMLFAVLTVVPGRDVDGRVPVASPLPASTPETAVTARMPTLPLRFEANAGQWDEHVRFVARQGGATLFITDEGMTIGLRDVKALPPGMSREQERTAREKAFAEAKTATVTMKLVGTKPSAPRGEQEISTKSNFFLGNDKTKWHANVANYGQVRAKDWTPGVDLVWHGGESGLEYDIEVAAGIDARGLALEIEGADRVGVAEDGSLEIATAAGALVQRPPRVVQDGEDLHTRYVMRGPKQVGFAVDGYDTTHALLIDPVLTYSTYLGGSVFDNSTCIAVDSAGSVYVAGYTMSPNFPTVSAYQGTYGTSTDVFITKLNASGNALVYSTYLGGSSGETAQGIALDASGNAYVTGATASTNFPIANAFQGASAGAGDLFVTKLNASGSALTYSTYLGGSGNEGGSSIALDTAGNAYVTGYTQSTNFPTVSPYQAANGGGGYVDAFVTKLNAAGSALAYSTYLGGSANDLGQGIAVDGSGNAYVAGSTTSVNFPTANAYQVAHASDNGSYDVFVTKLNASGSALTYSTYLGGNANDDDHGIAVDGSGNVFLTGDTYSTNFPTVSAYQGTKGSDYDVFVTKLNASGSALTYSTYVGGNGGDYGQGIAVGASGDTYVTGYTNSPNFPNPNSTQATFAGGTYDAFVTKLSASGSAVTYSTYLGGSNYDDGHGIALDGSGNAYVTGSTQSTDFPTASPYQGANGGGRDAFITKIVDPELVAGTPCTVAGVCAGGLACADGVCCDTACTNQCAACDVAGHVGTCFPVTGAPHGSRATCTMNGACASTCDGTNTKACTYGPSICASSCFAGSQTDSLCDSTGVCGGGAAHSCNNLVCGDAKTCKTKCASNADCVAGFTCSNTGACVPGGVCTDPHTSKGADNVSRDCAPYRCDSSGNCAKACVSVDDCLSPNVCNPSGQCVAVPSASTGGCNTTEPASTAPWFVLFAMLGISIVRVRVRKKR